ncbi:hypothetical protein KSC_029360 [Ktedonobacter sp. SOSP1-52]|nr:hypothetical protein KSC_029360 [Ktedonobacter sp. SOSP1-52]
MWGDNGGHHADRPPNYNPRNGSPAACSLSLMNLRDSKTMLQLIVGARQSWHIIVMEQAYCKVVGDRTKMLESGLKWPQGADFGVHLGQEGEISFTNGLTSILLRIGQDLFGLMHKAISTLKWRSEARCGL